jgi:hypothetical protein
MNWLAIPPAFWTALAYTDGVLAFVAGMLVVRAVRGTPVGWQPVCRRCKHDLRGVDPSKGTCPECGADLTTSGAVRTGGRVRRAGAIIVALIGVVIAGSSLWWLTPARIYQLRTDLVASMPFETLVDTALSGLGDKATRNTAFTALDSHLGTRSGFPQRNLARTLPSGELLDALLKTLARSSEPGRTPIAALLEGDSKLLFQSLDDAERARLLDLATEEIIASNAAKLDLARCAVASQPWTANNETVINELGSRLRATEAGRAVLVPRVVVQEQVTTGRLMLLDMQSPLDQLRKNAQFGFESKDEVLLIERAEVVPLADSSEAAPTVLRVVPDRGPPSYSRGVDMPALIADLPPGVHQLRVKGVVAPQSLVPSRRMFSGASTAAITPADAAKLDGARTIDQTLSLEIVEAPAPPPPLQRLVDADTIAKCTTWLRACRIESDSFGKSIDFARLMDDVGPGSRNFAHRFNLTVRQGDKSDDIGWISGSSNGGGGMSGGRLRDAVVATQPFEIVFDPMAYRDGTQQDFARKPSALVWARFTLRFANASSQPEVQSEPLPDTPTVATPLSRDEAQELLAKSLANLGVQGSFRRRARGMTEGFTIDFGPPTRQAATTNESSDAQPVLLAGVFALRSQGSLLAPLAPTVVALGSQGAVVRFSAIDGAAAIYPRTVRYTPSPAHGRAESPVSFRYIAEPFELRYADASTPPEIVWLKD